MTCMSGADLANRLGIRWQIPIAKTVALGGVGRWERAQLCPTSVCPGATIHVVCTSAVHTAVLK